MRLERKAIFQSGAIQRQRGGSRGGVTPRPIRHTSEPAAGFEMLGCSEINRSPLRGFVLDGGNQDCAHQQESEKIPLIPDSR